MSTKIKHPGDGRVLEIFSGVDDGSTYYLGDIIKTSDVVLNDIFPSTSVKGEDDWIVVKNNLIVDVVSRLKIISVQDDGSCVIINHPNDYEILREAYDI